MSTVKFMRDPLGNEQAVISTSTHLVVQIVQIGSGVYFAVKIGDDWSSVSTFRYAEEWRKSTGDHRPWNETFQIMVTQFVAESEEMT